MITITDAQKVALIETGKSILRFLWFTLLGALATALTFLATSGIQGSLNVSLAGYSMDLAPALTLFFGFVAKAIDRYVHENRDLDINGIAPEPLQR